MRRTTALILTILLLAGVCVACSMPDASEPYTPVPVPAEETTLSLMYRRFIWLM